MNSPPINLDYRSAGVDINAGNRLVERIKPAIARTHRAGVLGSLGGFGGLFELPLERYRQPVLVSGTDGVGTKLKLALELGKHDTIGIDLVAMCANDIIVCGAEPLFFLDYYASGKLDVDTASDVIAGIAAGCELAGAALIGGETAEMPGVYSDADYDLAGFCVGIVEKEKLIDNNRVKPGNVLIGLASSGTHSNGYSLIRKVLQHSGVSLNDGFDQRTLGQVLLEPTRIYVRAILALLATVEVNAIAHITGGGISENLPRVLPQHTRAVIELASWQQPMIFDWLREQGDITDAEMLKTFNCGVGMMVCVPASQQEKALQTLTEQGETAWQIGLIEATNADMAKVEYRS